MMVALASRAAGGRRLIRRCRHLPGSPDRGGPLQLERRLPAARGGPVRLSACGVRGLAVHAAGVSLPAGAGPGAGAAGSEFATNFWGLANSLGAATPGASDG